MQREVKNWFEQAKSDLVAARNSFSSKNFDWSCFQSQQAAEKALKACFLNKLGELRKVHDLLFLAKKIDLPENLVLFCIKLNKIYTETRYPQVDKEIPSILFTAVDARGAIEMSEAILQWVERQF